jgi:signal transduction histidine kinase
MRFVKRHWLDSFSRQLLVASAGGVVFGIGLLIAALFAMRFFQGSLFAEIGVSEYAESIGERLVYDDAGRPVSVGNSRMAWLHESLGREATFRVLDDQGNVVLSSEAGAAPLTGTGEQLVLGFHDFRLQKDGLTMHGATERVRHAGRKWYVQFAASDRLSDMLRAYVGAPLFSRSVAFVSVASLLLYAIVMRFLLRIILRPLNQASALAAGISPTNLGMRLPVQGVPSELRPLVENFNAALERLERNYRVQQEFLASAAHELKTPLTLIRGQIELGVDESNRHLLLQDVSRMGRQIQQLLHLAEASEPHNYNFAPVEMAGLIHEVVGYMDRLAGQHRVQLKVDVEPGATLASADRGALFTLLKNLIENAIQHSAAGGVVRLQATAAAISVADAGPGVPEADLPKIFTRFWRGAQRRDIGAGLGLSICREIAAAHGWELQALRNQPGLILELKVAAVAVLRQPVTDHAG